MQISPRSRSLLPFPPESLVHTVFQYPSNYKHLQLDANSPIIESRDFSLPFKDYPPNHHPWLYFLTILKLSNEAHKER